MADKEEHSFLEYRLMGRIVKKVKESNAKKIYAIDQLAYERRHEVIRLPPYHCQYNPIELIWA